MGIYKLTKRGWTIIAVTVVIGLIAGILGSIYLAVFGFIFCILLLGLMVYEIFFNRS